MPELTLDGTRLNLEAVTTSFDLGANLVDEDYYGNTTVDIEKCGACHENVTILAHGGSGRYGGSMQTCKACHATTFDGGHLEMQSRSIDSYVHAVHSFQPFDIGDINFAEPVEAMHFEHHIHFPYPTHGPNCESCHVAGAYEVPDQSTSMPGLLSASDAVEGRAINDIPSMVTGPAARACGACHKVELINEDSLGGLTVLNLHLQQGGYLIDAGETPDATLQSIIDEIMSLFH